MSDPKSEAVSNGEDGLPSSGVVSTSVSMKLSGSTPGSGLEYVQLTKQDGTIELVEKKEDLSFKAKEKIGEVDVHQSSDKGSQMELDRISTKRTREEEDEPFEKVLSSHEKKILKMQVAVEIYIYCKEKVPKQFALAKLFKEQGIVGVNKIKYLNPYKIRVEARDEVVANQIMFCKKFTDLNWKFQRALEVDVSYGVIKGVDIELEDEQILACITCPTPAILVAAKRLQKRDINGGWVKCEAVRLAFKGTTVPLHIYVDQLRIPVEPYVFPVTQCSRCWKLGHTAGRCSAKSIVCPKCGGEHENCTVTAFKCVNCSQSHMALEKRKCPVFQKEKRVRELMSEFRCTYRMALSMYVKPESPVTKAENLGITHESPIPLNKPSESEAIQASPTFACAAKTVKKKIEKRSLEKIPKESQIKINQEKKQKNRKSQNAEDWWSMDLESDSAESSVPQDKKKDKRNGGAREERKITFRELLEKLYNVIFNKREISLEAKIGEGIKLCVEWVVLVVLDNISEWPLLEAFMGFIYG
ncbi:hypothetical protein NE865_05835 [Phthorimaea operculella]|nr:hypothetical protein NE865_05835 [Phthorimaea operculella]